MKSKNPVIPSHILFGVKLRAWCLHAYGRMTNGSCNFTCYFIWIWNQNIVLRRMYGRKGIKWEENRVTYSPRHETVWSSFGITLLNKRTTENCHQIISKLCTLVAIHEVILFCHIWKHFWNASCDVRCSVSQRPNVRGLSKNNRTSFWTFTDKLTTYKVLPSTSYTQLPTFFFQFWNASWNAFCCNIQILFLDPSGLFLHTLPPSYASWPPSKTVWPRGTSSW
jgi:hypothetical protein